MGTYGTATGIYRWFDPVTRKGYLLSLQDGEIQASMIGEGITAADENILLDASGLAMQDMLSGGIISPIFGVGLVGNRIAYNKSFNFPPAWSKSAGTTTTDNTALSPDGQNVTADTLAFASAGDWIGHNGGTLTTGDRFVFSVWLRAASAGTLRLEIYNRTDAAVVASNDVAVKTTWKRFSVSYTVDAGDTASAFSCRIIRNDANQLASVYAWGSQISAGTLIPGPFVATAGTGSVVPGVSVDGVIYVPTKVLIGGAWDTLPAHGGGVFIGHNTGDGASGYGSPVYIGAAAGDGSVGNYSVAIGEYAAKDSAGHNVAAVGNWSGLDNVGDDLTALGYYAGKGNVGDAVTVIGANAGHNSAGIHVSAVGYNTASANTGDYVSALGSHAAENNALDGVIALGHGAQANEANQLAAGSSASAITSVALGTGGAAASPVAVTLRTSDAVGTDVASANLNIAGGRGTGTGAGGAVTLQTAPAGSSGSSQNALVDRITVAADGAIDFHNNTINNWAGPGGPGGSVTRWRLSFGC